MANRPNKALAEYIHQGDLIVIADDNAIANGYLWALVAATRTRLDALLADLKTKATIADTVGPAYDLKVEEKDGFDLDAEKALSMLAVYIENAFPDDAAELNHILLLDKDYPADDEKAKQYLTSVQAALAVHDNVAYPIPPAYIAAIDTATTSFISALAEVTDLFENRRTAIQDRNIALTDFIQVLSPIRKWLWKTLPQGREDTRLIDYGFDPYNKQYGGGGGGEEPEPEPEPEPEEFPAWPGPTGVFTLRYWGDGVVEIVYGGVQESTIGWLHRSVPGAEDWIEVNKHLPMNEEDILPFREMHVPIGMWEYRFIPMRGVEKGVASFALIEVV